MDEKLEEAKEMLAELAEKHRRTEEAINEYNRFIASLKKPNEGKAQEEPPNENPEPSPESESDPIRKEIMGGPWRPTREEIEAMDMSQYERW